MDTKEQLTILHEICRLDHKIIINRDKLQKLNRDSDQSKEAAAGLEATMSKITLEKEDLLKRRRLLDEKLQLEKANLRKWEARAEKIKGEREYTALMSEIGTQKRTLTGIEAELNEVTDELKSGDDKLKKASGQHEERLTSATRAHDSVKDLLDEEQGILQANSDARSALLDKLPKDLRMRYQRIYEKRGFNGVGILRQGVCQACMLTVPPELFIRVCKGEVLEQCPSCQRLLVAEIIE